MSNLPPKRPVNREQFNRYPTHPQRMNYNRPSAPTKRTQNFSSGYKISGRTGKPNKPDRPLRKALIILLFAAIICALIFYGLQKARKNKVIEEIAPYENVYGPEIYINDIPIAGLTPDQALHTIVSKMQERMQGWHLGITYNGWEFYKLTYQTLGIEVSESMFYPYLNEAWAITHTGDVFKRREAIASRAGNPYKMYTSKQEFDDGNLDTILQQIASSINKAPMDAALIQFRPDDVNPFLIRDEQVGIQMQVEKTKQDILELAALGSGGNYEIQPEIIQPKVTRADVEKTVALRAEASTSISKYSIENRNNNIRVAFSRINGTILKPGESFSFNKVVGPRTIKAGFFEAEEMVSGGLVMGIGGGVCQSSTTLYQAVLKSGLTVVDRSIHGAPVNYTEKGLDATVYLSRDRNIDFKFKNTSNGLIYITAHVVHGSSSKSLISRVRIYGESLGDGVVYKLKSVIDEELTTDEVIYVTDKENKVVTYKDETKLKRKMEKGYVVSTYLRKYQNGNMVEETLVSVDKYNPKPAEYWKGTLDRY